MGTVIAQRYEDQRCHQRVIGGSYRRAAAAVPSSGDGFKKVCYHWRAGRCDRHPCPFLHSELDGAKEAHHPPQRSRVWINPNAAGGNQGVPVASSRPRPGPKPQSDPQPPPVNSRTPCNNFIAGKECPFGERCKFLHSLFVGESFSLLATLQGHQKAITGIALPSGSDTLYSGSQDETVRAWNCHTGECLGAENMGGKIGCMISEQEWIFVGVPNAVKACNRQTSAVLTLDGAIGQVYALAVSAADGMLFAGTQDGCILAWKFVADDAGNCFVPTASLIGHQRAVVSLAIGAGRLYSGSMDNMVRVWDLSTLQCIHTLTGHTDVVMSVLCWDRFLLSGSLDGIIKVWAASESGDLGVIYSHNVEHGVLVLSLLSDAQDMPVLCCACNDNSVRLYDLPSFKERGRIFAKEEVRAASSSPGGIFFTGDGTGELKVWKWAAKEAAMSA